MKAAILHRFGEAPRYEDFATKKPRSLREKRKKDLLRKYIENAMSEIQQVEGMLH
jgi:hypothetical protein